MAILGKIQLILMMLFLVSCDRKPLPSAAETVAVITEMQELATVVYTVSKVVKANDNQTWYKIGDRKILITSEATVKAGIDLSALSEDHIYISGKNIRVYLPPPKILSVNLPPENIRVAFEDVSIFRSPFSSAERDGLLAQAELQIRNSDNETGILEQAKTNTQLFLSQFLVQLGFESVTISFNQPQPGGGR